MVSERKDGKRRKKTNLLHKYINEQNLSQIPSWKTILESSTSRATKAIPLQPWAGLEGSRRLRLKTIGT
jgi:hypothetical protein